MRVVFCQGEVGRWPFLGFHCVATFYVFLRACWIKASRLAYSGQPYLWKDTAVLRLVRFFPHKHAEMEEMRHEKCARVLFNSRSGRCCPIFVLPCANHVAIFLGCDIDELTAFRMNITGRIQELLPALVQPMAYRLAADAVAYCQVGEGGEGSGHCRRGPTSSLPPPQPGIASWKTVFAQQGGVFSVLVSTVVPLVRSRIACIVNMVPPEEAAHKQWRSRLDESNETSFWKQLAAPWQVWP